MYLNSINEAQKEEKKGRTLSLEFAPLEARRSGPLTISKDRGRGLFGGDGAYPHLLHDVGYQIVALRLNERKNDHRDREKHGQDHKSETPFLEKAVLFPTRPIE